MLPTPTINNGMEDEVEFFFNKDKFGSEDDRSRCNFRTSFYADRVNVLVGDIVDNGAEQNGRNVVDRGYVLLQRETSTDYLRLAFYKREARSEFADPLLVLPVGFIVKTVMKEVLSPTDSSKKKGRIQFYTRCTIDTKSSMDPMVVTLYMSLFHMEELKTALAYMTTKYPTQNLFFTADA